MLPHDHHAHDYPPHCRELEVKRCRGDRMRILDPMEVEMEMEMAMAMAMAMALDLRMVLVLEMVMVMVMATLIVPQLPSIHLEHLLSVLYRRLVHLLDPQSNSHVHPCMKSEGVVMVMAMAMVMADGDGDGDGDGNGDGDGDGDGDG